MLFILYYLVKHPHHAELIYHELDGIDIDDNKFLSQLSHLNAVINESSRLGPSIPTAGIRKTGPKGLMVGETYIPPETTIVAPRYSIFRSMILVLLLTQRKVSVVLTFYTFQEMTVLIRQTNLFPNDGLHVQKWFTIQLPSSHLERVSRKPPSVILSRWPTTLGPCNTVLTSHCTGETSCLGRTLSLRILRRVVAQLVKKYEFRFAPGEDGCHVYGDLADHFSATPGRLNLCVEIREEQ